MYLLQTMMSDMEIALQHAPGFTEFYTTASDRPINEMAVQVRCPPMPCALLECVPSHYSWAPQVLTDSTWPAFVKEYKTVDGKPELLVCKLPTEMEAGFVLFQTFYKALHSHRNLKLVYSEGTVTLRAKARGRQTCSGLPGVRVTRQRRSECASIYDRSGVRCVLCTVGLRCTTFGILCNCGWFCSDAWCTRVAMVRLGIVTICFAQFDAPVIKTLDMTTLQAAALMLFNSADHLSGSEIASRLGVVAPVRGIPHSCRSGIYICTRA